MNDFSWLALLGAFVATTSSAVNAAFAALLVFGTGVVLGALVVLGADIYSRRRHGR